MKSSCLCGDIQSSLEETEMSTEMRGVRCPRCNTFLSDHVYVGGDELRCWECDGRPHSHGNPPGYWAPDGARTVR